MLLLQDLEGQRGERRGVIVRQLHAGHGQADKTSGSARAPSMKLKVTGAFDMKAGRPGSPSGKTISCATSRWR